MSNISNYTVIDLDADYHRVYPIIRNDKAFAKLMADGLREYSKMRWEEVRQYRERTDEARNKYLYPLHADIWGNRDHAPWLRSYTDSHHQRALDLFNDWTNSDQPTPEERAIIDDFFGSDDEYEPTQEQADAYFALEQRFDPQPDQIEYLRTYGACHWLVDATVRLGELAYPDGYWEPLIGDQHSTVICHRTRRVLDLLGGGWPGTDREHPAIFAMKPADR